MIFEYINKIGNTRICDIDIQRHSDFTAVLCSQRSENPSAYVSDDADRIATQVCAEHGIDPNTMVWIEHFAEKIIPEAKYESWDIVEFEIGRERITLKGWRMIPKHEAQAILAGIRRAPRVQFGLHTEPSGPAFT